MMKHDVYCDMDGVLVDLTGGYHAITGLWLHELKEMGDAKWDAVIDHPNFWEFLPKMKDADVLMNFLAERVPDDRRHVLSARQHLFERCGVEKMRWIDRFAPVFAIRQTNIVRRKEKILFATQPDGTPNVLIDDYEKNIAEWEAAGGIGVLHRTAERTIAQLEEIF